MIAAWMLTYLMIGALLLVVAHAVDHVVATRGRPRRWVWMGAIVAMVVAPVVYRPVPSALRFAVITFGGVEPVHADAAPVAGRPTPVEVRTATAAEAATAPATVRTLARTDAAPPVDAPRRRSLTVSVARAMSGNIVVLDARSPLARRDRALAVAWGAIVLVVAGVVSLAAFRLARARRDWTRADDVTHETVASEAGRRVAVWIAPDTGPAAFGVRALQVVLPSWFAELPAEERALCLAHEAAHVRAGDPRLLAAGLALVVLAPWHVPLVLAYRRLCRAVEHDCDARVLARHRDVRGYGRLLVRTAEWLLTGRGTWRRGLAARWILAPVPAFAAPASELEGRLRALVRRPATWRTRLGVVAACAVGGTATIAACAVPSPTTGRSGDGAARAATAPVLDSLARWRALPRGTLASARVAERMHAVQDSLAVAAARRAIPTFDALARGFDTAYVWLVVDDAFRPVDHVVTMQWHAYRWDREIVGDPDDPRIRQRAAGPGTPPERLATDIFSFARAFPALDPRRIGGEGEVVTATPAGPVRVTWGRLFAGDTTQLDVFRAQGDSLRVPAWFRTVARVMASDEGDDAGFQRALERGLRDNIATFRPEFLERGNREDPYVWFVLGPDGTAIAHATGRAGLGLKRATWPDARSLPRAGSAASDSLLTIDGEAWRAKFPSLAVRPPSYGWATLRLAGRDVNVLWALTDLSLVTGEATARTTARLEATQRRAVDAEARAAQRLVSVTALFPDSLDDAARAARFREFQRGQRAADDTRFADLLRATIAQARPDLLRGRRTDADFVWLVLDSTARVVAADTGRAGLGTKVDGWRGLLGNPRATDRTARDSLVLDGDAWRAKFGDRAKRGAASTWQGLALPNGQINVLWTVAARDD